MGNSASGKTTYDKESGFVYIVNLYIINYMYYHMKKHESFYMKSERGKKPKSYDLFGDIFPISRERFARIISDQNFVLPEEVRQRICGTLGLNMRHFKKDGPEIIELFKIDISIHPKTKEKIETKVAVDETDWKCFLNIYRRFTYTVHSKRGGIMDEKSVEKSAEKVKEALKETVNTDWGKEGNIEGKSVYHIWYYFRYNVRFNEKSDIAMMKAYLEKIRFHDWNLKDRRQVRECYELLNSHCEFLRAYLLLADRLETEE